MKKLYFVLMVLCFFTGTNAQVITMQDPVLKNILVSTNCVDTDTDGVPDIDADSNNDNEIDYTEAAAVTNLYINGNVTSLAGLSSDSFYKIKLLSIKNTLLTTIRLDSFNFSTLLINNNSQLRGLYLSYIGSLFTLDCSNNQISTIQRDNTNSIKTLNCSNNNLTSLYLADLSSLTNLNCSNNAISNLYVKRSNLGKPFTAIEFNNNPPLSSICADYGDIALIQNKLNEYGITNVTVSSNCSATPPCVAGTICFDDAYFKYSIVTFTTADSNYDGEIQFAEALQLTSLDVNPNVKSLATISYFTNLTDLKIGSTQISGTVDIRSLVNLKNLNIEWNKFSSLNINGLSNLETVRVYNNSNLSSIYARDLTNLKSVVCTNNTNLSSFQTNSLPNLETMDISGSSITSLNLSGTGKLTSLKCSSSLITALNIGDTTSLTVLDFSYNKISNFNFASLTNVKDLKIAGNLFSSFDLTGLNNLEVLYCGGNNLFFLDLSYLPNLKNLNCPNCALTGLFIKNNNANPDLGALFLNGNPNLSHICADTVDYTLIQNSITSAGLSNVILDSGCDYSNPCGNNIVCINDVNFKNKLIALGVDSNNDKLIQISEALAVTTLDVSTSTTTTTNDIRNLDGIGKFTNLQTLNCSGNNIATLDLAGLNNLKTLNCSESKIAGLNIAGLSNLETVTCNNNLLASLSLTGLTNLKTLNCSFNVIQTLDCSNLTKLLRLDCNDNNITQFNFTNLKSLDSINCSGNKMTVLDFSNLITIKTIDFSKCSAMKTFIHTGLINLETLTFKSSGPLDAISLDLTNLTKLKLLVVSNANGSNPVGYQGTDDLWALDVSGLKNLTRVFCEGTKINSLDLSAAKYLEYLKFNYSYVSFLNIKNGTAFGYDSYGENFNTSHSHVDYLCIDDFENGYIDYCYQTNGAASSGKPNINSYCTYEPGGDYNTVTGVLKYDGDNNGCGANDVFLIDSRIKSTISSNFYSTYTNNQGSFTVNTNKNNITVTPAFQHNYFTAVPSSKTFNFTTPNSKVVADFCIVPNGVHHDLEIIPLLFNAARPGFVNKLLLVYKNNGNLPQSGAVSLSFDGELLNFMSATPGVSNMLSNSLTWNFSNLMPFETREIFVNFAVNAPTASPPANIGDVLKYTATISSNQVDENPTDNTINFYRTVTGSYDPNDKDVIEGSQINISQVGEYLHYMVRFQNTGTAEAVNVVVKDMITSNLDLNTLEMIATSDNCHVDLSPDNKLEFYFKNINLPAETINEPESHGYAAFKIKPKSSIGIGSIMDNTASIYFDYNFPIITNKVTTTVIQTLSNQDFSFGTYFNLYPNPVKDILHIETKQTIEVNSIHIYNQLGQSVLVIQNAQNVSKVDISNLTSGTYFVKVNTNKGTSNAKFIKN